MSRPGTPEMSETTALNLMQASSSSFSARCFSAVPGGHQVRAVPGQVPQLADRRRHEAGPEHLPPGDLAQPDSI
jgi:hypothetical protein